MLFAHASTSQFALWPHGNTPTGGATKVLWIVRNVHAGLSIVVRGRELGSTATFRQTFPTVGAAQYPSIVKLPHVGCWQLDVASGGARGTFVVEAVAP